MDTNKSDVRPLRCECGSDEVCVAYSAPVFVYVRAEIVSKVVVDDEDTRFGGVVRCLACDRFWILHEESEVSPWPAWRFGQ
jgi:uncharacterized Rossmann fold enzyme